MDSAISFSSEGTVGHVVAPGQNSGSKGPPKQDFSCFEILNVFRRLWFLSRDRLVREVDVAQKDDRGNIAWVEFGKAFHSHLVKCAFALLPPLTHASERMARRATFVFILEVLNREADTSFFDVKRAAKLANRAAQEKKRLSRKRSRAAKRERSREEGLVKSKPTPAGGTIAKAGSKSGVKLECIVCKKTFTSRKRAKRHTCKEVEASGPTQPVATPPEQIKLPVATPVTAPSASSSSEPSEGVKKCEFCDKPAVGTKGILYYPTWGEIQFDAYTPAPSDPSKAIRDGDVCEDHLLSAKERKERARKLKLAQKEATN